MSRVTRASVFSVSMATPNSVRIVFSSMSLPPLPLRAPRSGCARRLERMDVLAPMTRDRLQALQDGAPTPIASDQDRGVRGGEGTRRLCDPRLQLAQELCELGGVSAGQATDGPGVHLIDRGVEAIRFATGQDRLHAFDCRLMPPHQVAQDLAWSPFSNLGPGLASWPLEVGQSGLDALRQRLNEGFDLLTRCHDRNPPPRSDTQRTLASVGGAQTETAGVL